MDIVLTSEQLWPQWLSSTVAAFLQCAFGVSKWTPQYRGAFTLLLPQLNRELEGLKTFIFSSTWGSPLVYKALSTRQSRHQVDVPFLQFRFDFDSCPCGARQPNCFSCNFSLLACLSVAVAAAAGDKIKNPWERHSSSSFSFTLLSMGSRNRKNFLRFSADSR